METFLLSRNFLSMLSTIFYRFFENLYWRVNYSNFSDRNMLPAPSEPVDVIPQPTITVAPPVRGLFNGPVYFHQTALHRHQYRSDPQRFAALSIFDRQPISRAPDGEADPQKVNYVPPDPDPWVAVVYQQRQRRIENQQRSSEQQIQPELQHQQPPLQQLQQQQEQPQQQHAQQQQPEGNQQAGAKTKAIKIRLFLITSRLLLNNILFPLRCSFSRICRMFWLSSSIQVYFIQKMEYLLNEHEQTHV